MNITLNIDDEIAKRVHRIAADKNTTLAAMVRDYLTSVAEAETPELEAADRQKAADKLRSLLASLAQPDVGGHEKTAGEEAADKLRETIEQLKQPMGPRNWTRDDLYDRPRAYFKRD